MTHILTRRGTLKGIAAGIVSTPAIVRRSLAQSDPLPSLPNLSASDALLLQPGDRSYETYEPASNKRVLLRPSCARCARPRRRCRSWSSGRAATI